MALALCVLGAGRSTAGPAQSSRRAVSPPAAGQEVLLDRIWRGVQEAQRHSTACGTFTETRTSALLARPLLLRASFCVQGTTAFRVDYAEPEAMSIVYRDGYINVTRRREARTDAFEAGSAVSRAMRYFAGSDSVNNLTRDFAVSADEITGGYVLRMEPVAGRFKSRSGPVVATFDARDFRITRLEINGRNGVRSVFDIRVERLDVPLDASTFKMYRPSPGREPMP